MERSGVPGRLSYVLPRNWAARSAGDDVTSRDHCPIQHHVCSRGDSSVRRQPEQCGGGATEDLADSYFPQLPGTQSRLFGGKIKNKEKNQKEIKLPRCYITVK